MSEDVEGPNSAPNENRMEEFLTSLANHERFLAGYVYSLIPNSADAEDILQDIKVALWKNFEQFETGTNFTAWSKQIAFYRVIAFRKKKAKENERLCFSEHCQELLDADFECSVEEVSSEVAQLNNCLSKLKPDLKEMVSLRYKEGFSIEDVAIRMNKSTDACYKALSRVRLQLKKCLTKNTLRYEG